MDQRVVWSETVAGLHQIERELLGREPHGHSACGCAEVERLQLLGCRVDGGGGGAEAHPDAIALYRVVTGLRRPASDLLIDWAGYGLRPPVGAVELHAWPQRDSIGDVIVLRTEGERWRYCELRYIGGHVETVTARRLYAKWHAALVEFDAALSSVELKTIALVPLEAEPEPWRVDEGGRPATLLSPAQRAGLLAQARRGVKPARLAECFGLTVRQVHKQLEVARRQCAKGLTSVP